MFSGFQYYGKSRFSTSSVMHERSSRQSESFPLSESSNNFPASVSQSNLNNNNSFLDIASQPIRTTEHEEEVIVLKRRPFSLFFNKTCSNLNEELLNWIYFFIILISVAILSTLFCLIVSHLIGR